MTAIVSRLHVINPLPNSILHPPSAIQSLLRSRAPDQADQYRHHFHHQAMTQPPPSEAPSSVASFPPRELLPILTEVTTLLKNRGESVSIAETAAGGLISSSILSVAGASRIYKGGLTLYTLPSRIAYAGWNEQSIRDYRGPTTDVVSGLAQHVRRELESTYTLAESGTAGPTGGTTPNRTPGYVALAVDCERGTFVKELDTGLGQDRVGNMVRFAQEALAFLKDVVSGDAKL
nr:cina-like protein [Quercus suber]